MKHNHKFLLTVIAALGLPLAGHATTLTEAQITQIVKDVKTIDPGKGARPAALKETLQGEQAVRTGLESRTELLFNDHTITRLGANTHFSFSEGTRNMSLDSGVMLLQVPKGIGGAKIETAAVSAAVTGTTIMIEAGKDYTKLIVLEGECCLWPRNKKLEPSQLKSKLFRMRHEVCAEAGQEIILKNGSTEVPPPVYVNLKILENTSLLLNGSWGAPINHGPIDAAANGQGPNDYIPTNLAIVGAGTDVIIIQQQDPPGPPGPPNTGGNPPGSPGNPPFVPPSKYGPLITITSANPYTIGAGSAINTDPRITTNGVTSYGRIYRGDYALTLDGDPATYFFGPNSGVNDTGFNTFTLGDNGQLFPDYGVAAFKFTSLTLTGMPSIDMSTNGADDMVLISEGAINIVASGTLDFTGLHNLGFATLGGSIDIGPQTTIQGLSGSLGLFNKGATNNLTIDGVVNLPDGSFYGHTGGMFSGSGAISAQNADIKAGGVVTLNETQNSELNTTTDTVNGVQINLFPQSPPFSESLAVSALTLTGNEIDVINGFTGVLPQDEEPTYYVDLSLNSHASGTFAGDINLSGFIGVDSLTANAVNNITADSTTEISSNNAINFTAGGNVTFEGLVDNASDFIASGSNVTISSGASITTDNSVQLTATNAVEVDGQVTTNNPGSYFYASGASVTLSSSGVITSGSVQLTGNNSIEIDGTISANTEGGGNINANGGSVTTGSASNITTGNFTITSGTSDVTLDGYISVNNLSITGNNINTLSSITTTDSINASNSITFNATNNVTFDGSINTPSLTGTAGGTLTVQPTATISSDFTTLTAGALVLNGDIVGYSSTTGTFFGVTTDGGAGDVSGTGKIDALTISFNSAGDLNLDPVAGLPDTVNGIGINPSGNLYELDLTGATVEITPSAGFNASILKATATDGNLTIGSSLNLVELDGTALGNQIILTGSGMTISAGTINLAADAILNQTGTTGSPVLISTGTGPTSLSLAVGNNGTLTQTDGASSFVFVQSGTDGNPIASGTIPFMLSGSGSAPALTIAANSLTVTGTVDGSTFSGFALNLTSATDINNSGTVPTSAFIKAPTSVGLQVGVDALIVGSSFSQTIDYNNSQLVIDTSRLNSFSLGANSIVLEDDETGFPTLPGNLSLTSGGSNGITVNTSLTVGGTASFTANGGGDVALNSAVTAGSLTVMSSGSVGITTGDTITVTGTTVNTGAATLTATGTGSININSALSAGSIAFSAGGAVNTGTLGQLNTSGTITATAGNGISFAGDLGTYNSDGPSTPIGGDVTLEATSGNVSVTSENVIVAGSLSLTADKGDVTFGNGDSYLSIGGGVTLSAASTVRVADDVGMNGSLNISAGRDILATGESAVFTGATDVALTLTGTAAAISQSPDGSLLNFGGAGDSVNSMIGVALSSTAGMTVTSISGTGPSITLTGSFNVPVPLALTATSGSVAVVGSGTVAVSSFTANSSIGDIAIGEPLVLTGAFSGTALNGTVLINSSVNSDTFLAHASNVTINSTVTANSSFEADVYSPTGAIAGSGTVSSPRVSLYQQSSAATVSQTGTQASQNEFAFNTTLTIALVGSGSFPSSLTLQAAPLNFTSALTLDTTDLTLNGMVNTNGNSITAKQVFLGNVSTVTDGAGNASGLSVIGNDYVYINVAYVQGADGTKGNGGILTASTTNFDLTLNDYISANGGSAGGNGGTVNLTAQRNLYIGFVGDPEIDANGGYGSGNGGIINLVANTGDFDISDFSTLNANGGDASNATAAGGNGGTISGTAKQGNINVGYGVGIYATSGANGSSKFPGGAGGAVNLVAQGAVNINGNATIQVSSSDLVNNIVSAAPGNITVTSHAPTGTAINIASTAQLNSILNQAAVGPGGTITFLADKGGDIAISGTVRADHGTVSIVNSGTASGNVSLAGATLYGDVVKASVLSPNGTLTVGSQTAITSISADTAIKLYALGSSGSVIFAGNTYLSGNSIKTIAGDTVQITQNYFVNVTGGAATVYTNHPNYNTGGFGSFTGNGVTTTTLTGHTPPAF